MCIHEEWVQALDVSGSLCDDFIFDQGCPRSQLHVRNAPSVSLPLSLCVCVCAGVYTHTYTPALAAACP